MMQGTNCPPILQGKGAKNYYVPNCYDKLLIYRTL